MCSKVRRIAALAIALALAAGAARALPPPAHRPQPTAAPAAAGLADAARVWLTSWFRGPGGERLSALKGKEGSFIDPNGLLINILKILKPPTVTTPQPGSTPAT
jgi:hypothetical protein